MLLRFAVTALAVGLLGLTASGQKLDDKKPADPAGAGSPAGAAEKSPKVAPPEKAPAKPKVEAPLEFNFAFADDSNVKAVVLEPSVVISTRYGKLTVPFPEIKRVELGFRYPEGVEARLQAAIEKLGAASFQDRIEAEKELLAEKDFAGPLVKKATKHPDAEVARRAEDLLKALRKTLPEERFVVKDTDLMETADFTIRGRIELATVRVRTRQFGETTLKMAEVKQFRSMAGASGTGELTLEGAKHARLNWGTWLDTGLDVASDAPLSITTTGQIDQWPQEPGRYMASPAGGAGQAPNTPQMMMRGVPGQPFGPNGMPAGMVRSGCVVGKIGDSGIPFPVGASFRQARATSAGRLYLLIAPSNWNNDECAGEYKVKVKIGE